MPSSNAISIMALVISLGSAWVTWRNATATDRTYEAQRVLIDRAYEAQRSLADRTYETQRALAIAQIITNVSPMTSEVAVGTVTRLCSVLPKDTVDAVSLAILKKPCP